MLPEAGRVKLLVAGSMRQRVRKPNIGHAYSLSRYSTCTDSKLPSGVGILHEDADLRLHNGATVTKAYNCVRLL